MSPRTARLLTSDIEKSPGRSEYHEGTSIGHAIVVRHRCQGYLTGLRQFSGWCPSQHARPSDLQWPSHSGKVTWRQGKRKPTNTRPGPQTQKQPSRPTERQPPAEKRQRPRGQSATERASHTFTESHLSGFRRPSFLVSTLVGERKVFALLPLAASLPRVSENVSRTEEGTIEVLVALRHKGSQPVASKDSQPNGTLIFKTLAALRHKGPQSVAPQGLATRQHSHFSSKAQTVLEGKMTEPQKRRLCRLNSVVPLWQTLRLRCTRSR